MSIKIAALPGRTPRPLRPWRRDKWWFKLIWRYPMGVFTCEKCGNKVDTRCKPKKCPACSESGTMCKQEAAPAPKKDKK